MNMKIFIAGLALCVMGSASAQTKGRIQKDDTIAIRKKSGNKDEKMTIVVDGDHITINGKPIEDMTETDLKSMHDRGLGDMSMWMPKIRGRFAPGADMKMFGDDFRLTGNRAFLGVGSEKTGNGARITSIEKESAAEKAGLKKDDIITKVGDTKIEGSEDLYEAIGKYKPEEKVTIGYLRDGKEASVTATLGKSSFEPKIFNFKGGDFNKDFNFEMPAPPDMKGMDFNFNMRRPRLGVEIQDLAEGKGVKILDVDADTPAGKSGLQKDDVITEIDGKAVASVDELKASLRERKEGDTIKVTYQRSGTTRTADIKFPKKIKTAEL